jgi:hypothetical protein
MPSFGVPHSAHSSFGVPQSALARFGVVPSNHSKKGEKAAQVQKPKKADDMVDRVTAKFEKGL